MLGTIVQAESRQNRKLPFPFNMSWGTLFEEAETLLRKPMVAWGYGSYVFGPLLWPTQIVFPSSSMEFFVTFPLKIL